MTRKKIFGNAEVRLGNCSIRDAAKSSSHHDRTSAAFAVARCKISDVSVSQQLGKPIRLVKVWATRKDRAQHFEGKWLEYSSRKEWKEIGPDSEEGKEKKSIDRKRAFAGKLEGM